MLPYKTLLKKCTPYFIWRYLRRVSIIKQHKKVAKLCEHLIQSYSIIGKEVPQRVKANKNFNNDRIIWQYWAQGYDDVPELIRICLRSVEENAGDFKVIRLSDNNLHEYIDLPAYIYDKKAKMTTAHFSDILRVALLYVYGGLWLDASVYLSGRIPEDILANDFFVFQRDSNEPNKSYWENTYAYYFGWYKGFRVNMLSSIMWAKKGATISEKLCRLLLDWWFAYEYLPDYFFLQILYDVIEDKKYCPIYNDCLPHYLMQKCTDQFPYAKNEEIFSCCIFHKLSYKNIDVQTLNKVLNANSICNSSCI